MHDSQELSSHVQAEKEATWYKKLLKIQAQALALLLVTGAILFLVELYYPDFFNFPYTQSTSLAKIQSFWPLFVYGGFMAVLGNHFSKLQSTSRDESILALRVTTSLLAGLWEEIGFRCLYICTSMIGVMVLNWLFGTYCAFLIAIAFCICSLLGFGLKSFVGVIGGIACIAWGGMILWMFFNVADPVYWIYEHLLTPVINFTTFGYLHDILYGDYPQLFVLGIIVANAEFRDGHKYQGILGFITSWYLGLVMVYAVLNYGLWTAVCVHAIYDLGFDFIQYFFRKLKS